MRHIFARFGLEAGAHAQPIEPRVQCRQRIARGEASPELIDPALAVEPAETAEPCLDSREPFCGERHHQRVCPVPVGLADEAHRGMQLRVALPACRAQPLHPVEQQRANGNRRHKGKEQSHGKDCIVARRDERKTGFA